MPNRLAALVAGAMICQGCYLGHDRIAKTIAYSGNGALAAGGIILIASAAASQPNFIDLRPQVEAVGAIALVIGLCGIVVNLTHDLPPPSPPFAPLPTAPAPPAGSHPTGGFWQASDCIAPRTGPDGCAAPDPAPATPAYLRR